MQSDIVQRLLKFDWRGKVRTATAHEAAAEITRLTEALRAAESAPAKPSQEPSHDQ